MEIQPNRPFSNLQRTRSTRKSSKTDRSDTSETSAASADGLGSSSVSFFSELVDRLSKMPEMREEILAEARDLLHDPDYPSEEELMKLEMAIAQRRKVD